MHAMDHRGHTIRYVDRGEGTPIVFLHNGALDHWLWERQLRFFEQTHRVVAPDFLGHGRSDRPPGVYTADDFVAQVEHLVDHLGLDDLHLVGCCVGGGVALLHARRHAERVRSVSVVTVATPNTVASGVFARPNGVTPPGSRLRDAGDGLDAASGLPPAMLTWAGPGLSQWRPARASRAARPTSTVPVEPLTARATLRRLRPCRIRSAR